MADGGVGATHPRPLGLQILTPAATLVDVPDVAWLRVPLGDGGEIGIRPGHGALLAETACGEVRYADAMGVHTVALEAGLLSVSHGRVTILTGGAAQGTELGPPGGDDGAARYDRLAQALFAALKGSAEEGHGETEA